MEMSSVSRIQSVQLAFTSLLASELPRACVPPGIKNPLWWGLSDRLRQLGLDNGLSQTVIGARAGMPGSTITKIELRTVRAPMIDTVEKIATGLGISPVWLAFGDQGHLAFKPRYPRPALPYDPPVPDLTDRPFEGRYRGVADRLKLARQLRGYSLRQAGKAAVHPHAPEGDRGLSGQAVLDIEAGARIPYVDTCEALAVALDVSPGWLAFGEGEGPEAAG